MSEEVPNVAKTVTVPVPVDEAFDTFVQRPLEWWPPAHVFVRDRQSITIEPRAGGRYYERGADGTEVAWGTVVEWRRPYRLVLTWRVGPNWQPVFDDERASLIRVDFTAMGPSRTLVTLTHAELHRHGEIAPAIHRALDGPSPGETLARFAEVIGRRASRPA